MAKSHVADLRLVIDGWTEGYRELTEAFIGLPDEDVWRRPHPTLLSIGELAGHIAYWDAVWITGSGPNSDLGDLPITSPLIDSAFRYFTTSVEAPVQLELGAQAVLAEVVRVQSAARDVVLKLNPDSEDKVPWSSTATWGQTLQYRVFHVAYHTGQIYSVRHLFGHETSDN